MIVALPAPTRIDEREAAIAAMLTGAVFIVVGYAFGLGVGSPASVSAATPAAIDPGVAAAPPVPGSPPPLLTFQPPAPAPVAFGLGTGEARSTGGAGHRTPQAPQAPAAAGTPAAAPSPVATTPAATQSPLCPTPPSATGVLGGSDPLTGLLAPVTSLLTPVTDLVTSLLGGLPNPAGPLPLGATCQLGGGL